MIFAFRCICGLYSAGDFRVLCVLVRCSLLRDSRARRIRFLFNRRAPVTPTRVLLNRSNGRRAIGFRRAVTRHLGSASRSTILAQVSFSARLFLIHEANVIRNVHASFAIFRDGALDGLTGVNDYRVLVNVRVMGFLLRRLKVDRFKYRISVINGRRRAHHVAIGAACEVSTFAADIFRRLRCHLAILQIIANNRVVLQLIRGRMRLAFSTRQLVVGLGLIHALRFYSRFDGRLAVGHRRANYSGFVDLTAKARAHVNRGAIRAGQYVQIGVLFLMFCLLLVTMFYVEIVISQARLETHAPISVVATALLQAAVATNVTLAMATLAIMTTFAITMATFTAVVVTIAIMAALAVMTTVLPMATFAVTMATLTVVFLAQLVEAVKALSPVAMYAFFAIVDKAMEAAFLDTFVSV